MTYAASMQPTTQFTGEVANLDSLFRAVGGRYSSNPLDKIFAIAFPFHRREPGMPGRGSKITLPIYDSKMPLPAAWDQLIACFTSTNIGIGFGPRNGPRNELRPVEQTPTIQLLCLFPHPSRDHWFPCWAQIQHYPDVSVTYNDPVLSGGIDPSLRILSGRIYRGCSLRVIQPPTPETEAIYCATMDGNDAHLVATVPGVKPNIISKSKYVLVEFGPDRTLQSNVPRSHCDKTNIGHGHPPVWQESIVIVCEEVGTLSQPTTGTTQVPKGSSSVMRYRLRRVTTLKWDCRLPAGPRSPSLGRWLPFKPSLVHIRSVVCSANGGYKSVYLLQASDERDIDIFCEPEAVAGQFQDGWQEDWDKRWPSYEVYLV